MGVFLFLIFVFSQRTFGDSLAADVQCRSNDGQFGLCISIQNCPWAIRELKRRNPPKICAFEGLQPVVCCLDFPNNEEVIGIDVKSSDSIAAEKCRQYGNARCNNENLPKLPISIIVGGTDAHPTEFPHMAALGYGNESNIQWECGGSLISENFVLTAAHCLISRQSGDLKFVRLGDINLESVIGNDRFAQQFTIEETFEYPGYNPFSHYHDIALIKLSRSVDCTQYVKPACLYVDNNLPDGVPIATGWGATEWGGRNSDILQKVNLGYISYSRCKQTYRPEPKLRNGIDENLHICVGDGKQKKDTCQGDSGGPLQVKVNNSPPIYKIIGITSFGKLCALAPGVYTKVSHYIPWIESIVWNN